MRNPNPSTEWYKGLNQEAKDNFEKTLRNSTLLLARLNDILDGWEKDITRKELSEDGFNGDWAFRQAFLNGDRRRLQAMKDLISFYK